jgi:V8-like Glu-specific endopeptidase
MKEQHDRPLTFHEAYCMDHPVERKKEHDPCSGLPGKDAERLETEALTRLVADVALPEACHAKDIETRYAPCARPLRPRHLDSPKLAGLPKAVLMRSELTMEKLWPWCTIGKIFVGKDEDYANPMWSGSGVLVGPNLLLTASHVAPWNFQRSWWMRFVPAYRNGASPFGISYVQSYRGIRNTDDVTGLDYVICKLYTRLGDGIGWMGSQSWSNDDSYLNGRWTSVGYPSDSFGGQVPMIELDIALDDIDDEGSSGKELESYVFATAGWSGGPLWGWINDQPRIVGVMSGFEEEFSFWDFFTADHSVSAGGGHMVDLVKYGWSNWT